MLRTVLTVFLLLVVWPAGGHAQQFQCPPGSTAVSAGGGIMCQCPDGSYAGHSGCLQQYTPQVRQSVEALTQQQIDWCVGKDPTPDQQLRGCTVMIKSGRYQGRQLAVAFLGRGVAYRAMEEYDQVIAEDNQAIQIDPTFALAFQFRGDAYLEKGDVDRAIQDLDAAIRLDPRSAAAFQVRGRAYVKKDQYDRGMQDFTQALRLNPLDPQYSIYAVPVFDNYVREKICKPVMRDVFAGQSNEGTKKLQASLADSCNKCFLTRLDDNGIDGEGLLNLVLVLTGGSNVLSAEATNRLQTKYDAVFTQCSEELVKAAGEKQPH